MRSSYREPFAPFALPTAWHGLFGDGAAQDAQPKTEKTSE
jgi:hypothetical protein